MRLRRLFIDGVGWLSDAFNTAAMLFRCRLAGLRSVLLAVTASRAVR